MSYTLAGLAVLASMILAAAGVVAVRRVVPLPVLRRQNEIAVPVFLQVGVACAVLLAFAVTLVWGQYDLTARHVDEEAAALLVIASLSRGVQEERPGTIGRLVLDYAETVVEEEWPALRRGRSGTQATAALAQLWAAVIAFEPRPGREATLHAAMLDALLKASEQRRLRLFHARQPVPAVIWVLLVATAVVTVGLALTFGMDSVTVQAALTAALSGSMAAVLVLVALLDLPFSGGQVIAPDAFEAGIRTLRQVVLR
ncbi:bestrophin-like domain [Falsiroseomonas oryzae]|uniref:bestrophin-like domain n=1 Tax=Falsiroseomonas oryzae TaxID=2766473 RepID=UPI0022EB33C9|nr:DUF4239 domain-containing protein [Roseomonas sp. MO-31]